ncbi:hypothetical protein PpBr36_01319 [Pyricularia pennisetigena]|uniref:hypothetical protein n=1 Tax=Pyricularia pennisetigena TaxID=1578925 RepID=UPI00115336E9|nr:hypothetical protein PpBr36_01319 [Pyricularia pennisetigena]TLS28350.1 hypothetical protein PpBr36_01319 [Pyricularia pennisetigena]
MGIKGIYPEIGPGERISLCKLAVQTLEEKRRPLRIAIDISIWQFQIQAARGGANAPTRTLFYRLARLLGHSIQPIFVFDGPNKPAFKRNRRSTTRGGSTGDVVSNAMAKRMISLFGFQFHDAPGEAEAECALLQRRGIVDAVLSEDVDTIMFGCTRTLRNWSSEGVRGSKEPTHVSMYDSAAIKAQHSGLDREGMVLVALMSGGDYIPQGVPGCGVKVACEAARGGFGHSLCRIKRSDSGALVEWREKLLVELRDNKSGFFRVRHKALVIPDDFPNLEVLRYYTHPVVSQEDTLKRLEKSFPSSNSLDVQGLRQFVAETFDWTGKIGAIKFIRVLAPSLFVQKLLQTPSSPEEPDMEHLVKDISKSRSHFTTDGTKEVRVSFIPTDIVDIDLDKEPEESPEAFGRSGLALNSDDDLEELELGGNGESEAAKPGPKKVFDPTQPCSEWVPELILQFGAPKALRDWHTRLEAKSATAQKVSNTTRTRKAKTKSRQSGGLDRFLTVTKKPTSIAKTVASSESQANPGLSATNLDPGTQNLPVTKIIHTASGQSVALARNSSKQSNTINTKKPKAKLSTTRQDPPPPSSRKAAASKPASAITNPWTIASSQPNRSSNRPFSRTNTYPHAGNVSSATPFSPGPAPDEQPVFISSSPPIFGPDPEASLNTKRSPLNDKKHPRRSPVPEDSYELDPFSSDSSLCVPSARKQRSPTSKLGRSDSSVRQRQATPPTTSRGEGAGDPVARSKKLASVVGYAGEIRSESVPAGTQKASGELSGGEGELQPNRPKFISPYSIVDLSDGDDNEQQSRRSRPISTASLKESLDGRGSPAYSPGIRSGLPVGSSEHMSGSGQNVEDEFIDPGPKITTSAKSNTTKLYIPRKSAVGFIREVEVSREEADRLMREQSGSDSGGRSRMFRRSDIAFVDLTGSSP